LINNKDYELNELFKDTVQRKLEDHALNGKPIPLPPFAPLPLINNFKQPPPSFMYPNQNALTNSSSKFNTNSNTTTTSNSTVSNKSTTYYNQDMRHLINFNEKKYEEDRGNDRYKKYDHQTMQPDYQKSYKNNTFHQNSVKNQTRLYKLQSTRDGRGGVTTSKTSRSYNKGMFQFQFQF
jgi:hypothetical protein